MEYTEKHLGNYNALTWVIYGMASTMVFNIIVPAIKPNCLIDTIRDITPVRSLELVTRAMSAKRAEPTPAPIPVVYVKMQILFTCDHIV